MLLEIRLFFVFFLKWHVVFARIIQRQYFDITFCQPRIISVQAYVTMITTNYLTQSTHKLDAI